MHVRVTLYSLLRDLLPKEARGRAELDLPDGATLGELRARLSLPANAVCAVNGQVVRDDAHPLRDGDQVGFFRASGGG